MKIKYSNIEGSSTIDKIKGFGSQLTFFKVDGWVKISYTVIPESTSKDFSYNQETGQLIFGDTRHGKVTSVRLIWDSIKVNLLNPTLWGHFWTQHFTVMVNETEKLLTQEHEEDIMKMIKSSFPGVELKRPLNEKYFILTRLSDEN